MESFFHFLEAILSFLLGTFAIVALFLFAILVLIVLNIQNLYRELQHYLARRKARMPDSEVPTESRMKHQILFWIVLGIFAVDLVVPDLVPFLDEILLGLLATYFGLQRERVPVERQLPKEAAVIDLGEVESKEVD